MADLSNAEISVEGEYGECLVCGESFHWTQLTNTEEGSYCEVDATAEAADLVQKRTLSGYQAEKLGAGPHLTVKEEAFVDAALFDGEADMGHDTNLERATFGDAIKEG